MTQPQIRTIHAFTDSPEPQNAFVGLFDVLGFQSRVGHASLRTLIGEYRQFVGVQSWARTIPVASPAGVQLHIPGNSVFSDTILLWCNDDWNSIQTLITASASMIAAALDIGWPLRGGIAYGECVLDITTSTFVGKPIVDAYRTEQSQNWIGGAIHSSVIAHPILGERIAQVQLEDVVQYKVPTKFRTPRIRHAIHWCPYARNAMSSIVDLEKRTKSWKAKRKYTATKRYISNACQGYHAVG